LLWVLWILHGCKNELIFSFGRTEKMEPVSRDYLRGLNAQKNEEARIHFVETQVRIIYSQVKHHAEKSTETLYKHDTTGWYGKEYQNKIDSNMSDIVARLRSLFPDSSVEFKTLSRGQDGKMYDIRDIDERMKPFINTQFNQQFIVVDWT
jgi:hypothetical protein